MNISPPRPKLFDRDITEGFRDSWSRKIIGQPAALDVILPYIRIYEAGLAPEGRPAGVFLLLGPTGTGKTRTVEVLAEILHGSTKNVLRIDCGEYQLDHEVAKLIGAPPGYLGHRETQPLLTQQRINAMASAHSRLSLVLFDEIEKAAPSLIRLLLGVLDRATLRLGDNSTVVFDHAVIFFTSNLGAREMNRQLGPGFGFQTPDRRPSKLDRIAVAAARRKMPPEFLNRVDGVVTFQPFTPESLEAILDQQIREIESSVVARLGWEEFRLEVLPAGREFLLRVGFSTHYGARELRRAVHRHLIQPLCIGLLEGRILPGETVVFALRDDGETLEIRSGDAEGRN